jgi:ribosomal protein S12 methylthiotransferase accessory factor YcaO
MIVQIANNAKAPDLTTLGVQSLARDIGFRDNTWLHTWCIPFVLHKRGVCVRVCTHASQGKKRQEA